MEISDKKIIAEWMGWKVILLKGQHADEYWIKKDKKVTDNLLFFDHSSPDCPQKVWQEIWANMKDKEKFTYSEKVSEMLEGYNCEEKPPWFNEMLFHTASNEIKTKALLQMIKEGKND